MNPPAHPHVERVVLIFWFACTSEFMVMVNYWRSLRVVQGLSTLLIPSDSVGARQRDTAQRAICS